MNYVSSEFAQTIQLKIKSRAQIEEPGNSQIISHEPAMISAKTETKLRRQTLEISLRSLGIKLIQES
jgi:hypothetical protein